MRLSVIIPVFNKAPFLKECLESVLNGSFRELEVIAVDDASTDGSLAILNAVDDPRLNVIALDRNVGPAMAAQQAMDAAMGNYIARIDADDVMLPGRLEKQVAFMDAAPDLVASGGQVQLFGAENAVWKFPTGRDQCRVEMLFGQAVCQGAAIYRRRALLDHGIRYEEHWPRIGEDWLFWAKLSRSGAVDNLNEILIRCRRGPNNSTHGLSRAERFEPMVRLLLPMLGLPADDASVKTHLFALRAFSKEPVRTDVITVHHWFRTLREWNERTRHCDKDVFHTRLQQQWDQLFYALADRAWLPALQHITMTPRSPFAPLNYLLGVRTRRSIGRIPN